MKSIHLMYSTLKMVYGESSSNHSSFLRAPLWFFIIMVTAAEFELKTLLASKLYEKEELSLRQAARAAGLSKRAFIRKSGLIPRRTSDSRSAPAQTM
jgi:hypothetical protein